jgi:hypothetical protein
MLRPTRPALLLLLIAGCRSTLTTYQHARPFHSGVGCWRVLATDTLPDYERRLMPGPVDVRLTTQATQFHYSPREGAFPVRQVDLRLDVLGGLKGHFYTAWLPLAPDTVGLDIQAGGHNALSIRAGIKGDSLQGLAAVGAANTRVGIVGWRIKC